MLEIKIAFSISLINFINEKLYNPALPINDRLRLCAISSIQPDGLNGSGLIVHYQKADAVFFNSVFESHVAVFQIQLASASR